MAAEGEHELRGSVHDSGEIDDEWQQVEMKTNLCTPEIGSFKSSLGLSSRSSPSRGELLTIVRKHAGNIGIGNAVPHESETDVDVHFWQQMLDMYFVRGLQEIKSEKKTDEDDDLIFFVSLEGVQHANGRFSESGDEEKQPYFVRRWAPELAKVVGGSAWEVDWRRSFYLNLIAHTSFALTIAICSRQSLKTHQHGSGNPLTTIYKVTKTVYASPSRTNFLPDSKAVETVAAYPDICFVVDDYDFTFNDVVLAEPDHCYCVLLTAGGGAAFPDDDDQSTLEEPRTSREVTMLGEMPEGSTASKITLFSGFVNYDMVRNAYEGGKRARFEDIFQLHRASKSERLIMRGPGGRGEVEVAVSSVINDHQQSPPLPAKPGAKFGAIMRKAAEVATTVAKNVVAAASDDPRVVDGLELGPLRCCLMSLSLPWDSLARDLLFKELPK